MPKLFLNQQGVAFVPWLDKQNNYRTIVCNSQNGRLFKVDKMGYFCLKLIEENPGREKGEILELLKNGGEVSSKLSNEKIEKFIDQMIRENVILSR